MHDHLTSIFDELLDDMPLSMSWTLDGAHCSVVGQINNAYVNASDGLVFWMDATHSNDHIDGTVPAVSGSIRTTATLPTMSQTTVPGYGTAFGVNVAVSDDLINQILYKAFRSGVEQEQFANVYDACSSTFYNLVPEICDEMRQYQPHPLTDPVLVDVQVRAKLPPVFTIDAGGGQKQIALAELFFYLYADGASGSQSVFTFAATAFVNVSFGWNNLSRSLTVSFGAITAAYADPIDDPLDVTTTNLDEFAELFIDLALPAVADSLEGFNLPLVESGGMYYRMDMDYVVRIDPATDYLGIYGDFVAQ
jgi:hypothetical protein